MKFKKILSHLTQIFEKMLAWIPQMIRNSRNATVKDASPALTFKIEQEYFENFISDEDNDFVLADGFYSRTIHQDELTLAFDTTDSEFNSR